jgi:hypothetical protein
VAPATLSLLALLMLTVWRLVFAALRFRPLAREVNVPQQRHRSRLRQRFHIILDRAVLGAGAANSQDDVDEALGLITPRSRAQAYLRRVAALTGATQMGGTYILEVGKTRFEVRDRWVSRLRDVTDPNCMYDETCFYSAHKDMPKAEQIATVLLQLKNNPELFDSWAAKNNTAFKADGQIFTRTQFSRW